MNAPKIPDLIPLSSDVVSVSFPPGTTEDEARQISQRMREIAVQQFNAAKQLGLI